MLSRGATRGETQKGVVGVFGKEEREALSNVELFPPRDSGLRPPTSNKGKMCQVFGVSCSAEKQSTGYFLLTEAACPCVTSNDP